MRHSQKFIRIPVVLLYETLLRLFPSRFRAEFIEEIWDIFLKVMLEAENHGWLRLLNISVRELSALLISLIRESLHEARSQKQDINRSKDWRWEMSQRSGARSTPILFWMVANILGFGALAALPFVFPSLPSIPGIVTTILIFMIPGLAQWLVLRRFFPTSILWVLTIPMGVLLYWLILQAVPGGLWQQFDDESVAVLTVAAMVIGLLIGLLQWLILRRQFSGSVLWLLGSTAGVGLTYWLILATGLVNTSGIIAFVVGVLVYPLATGSILAWLIAHHDRSQANAASAI